MLSDLPEERKQIGEAMIVLERIAVGSMHRRLRDSLFLAGIPFAQAPDNCHYRNVWSAAELQAKN